MAIILGLDLSLTNTGLVMLHNGKVLDQKLIKTKSTGDNHLDELKRLLTITDQIPTDVALAVIEGPAFMARNTTALCQLAGLNYLIRDKLFKHKVPFVIVAPTTLKKFILGKGNGEKSQVMLELYKRYNVSFGNDNISDAYVLAKIGETLLGYNGDKLIKAQEEVINLLKKQIV